MTDHRTTTGPVYMNRYELAEELDKYEARAKKRADDGQKQGMIMVISMLRDKFDLPGADDAN